MPEVAELKPRTMWNRLSHIFPAVVTRDHVERFSKSRTVPVVDDEAQRGEGEQDIAGHAQNG